MWYCLGRTKNWQNFSGQSYPPDTQVKVIGYKNGHPVCEFPGTEKEIRVLNAPQEIEVGT